MSINRLIPILGFVVKYDNVDYDDDATTIAAFATTGQVFVLVKIIGAWINIRLVTQWFLVVVCVYYWQKGNAMPFH